MGGSKTTKERALVTMEREHYEEAKRHGLVMDFEEFVSRYFASGRDDADALIASLPCDPFIYVGDTYAHGDKDLKGQIVVEYELANESKIVSTMDDYLSTTKLRLDFDESGASVLREIALS